MGKKEGANRGLWNTDGILGNKPGRQCWIINEVCWLSRACETRVTSEEPEDTGRPSNRRADTCCCGGRGGASSKDSSRKIVFETLLRNCGGIWTFLKLDVHWKKISVFFLQHCVFMNTFKKKSEQVFSRGLNEIGPPVLTFLWLMNYDLTEALSSAQTTITTSRGGLSKEPSLQRQGKVITSVWKSATTVRTEEGWPEI